MTKFMKIKQNELNTSQNIYSHNPFISWCLSFSRGGMMFNATFNKSAVISWRSALLVEETGVPGENHRPIASH